MDTRPQRQKGRDTTLSSLNAAIDAMNIAKDVMSMTPAKAAFGSVSIILTMIRDSIINEEDYVDLGLACADVCRALDRGMNERRAHEVSRPVLEAIEQLTTAVAEIQRNVAKRSKRNVASRLFHSRNDREKISAWRLDLNRILHVFSVELAINTNVVVSGIHNAVVNTQTTVSEIHHIVMKSQEGTDGKNLSTQNSVPGESPPPPPRVCFGREELIENIISLTENLTPIALIGAGGIGKTSIALTVLHHDRVKERFGANRRFIRCNQFPASRTHFLSQLSKVIGAGIEHPEDLTPLRPFLSSREIILFLDNAESVLDPQGTDAREIYTMVEELSRFKTVCLCITSRISTVPRHCKHLTIPKLSMEPACDIFYSIYDDGGRSNVINNLLERLDFHALSITLLATTASHNMWDCDRLVQEWDTHRVQVLQTDYNESLAATIELSLASPTFRKLGPPARDLLGVIALLPQGIDESNLDWLFPTISDRRNIFDKFCTLSLTYRSNGFITMLAPLRDYLSPKDPMTSPLLCTTKDCYFRRLSVDAYPDKPGYEGSRWITSEDANVEHLLDVFTSIDANSADVWVACCNFMEHLFQHKPQVVVLGPKIEGLPDDHPSKPRCLFALSRLFFSVGIHAEYRRLLTYNLWISREQGNDSRTAQTLVSLAESNMLLDPIEEGIELVGEALEIYEQLDDAPGQADALQTLAQLLSNDNHLDAAEEAASRAISLLPDEGEEFRVCQCHRVLGNVHRRRGNTKEAINHIGIALGIASSFGWHDRLARTHYLLAMVFSADGRFDDAHTHVELAKSHAINRPYNLGRAMVLQARFWYEERRLKEAKSEVFRAIDVFEKLGATDLLIYCRCLLHDIEREMWDLAAPDEPDSNDRSSTKNVDRNLLSTDTSPCFSHLV